MKKVILCSMLAALLLACGGKKTETVTTSDSTAVDSTVLADKPAPSILAFSPIPGLSINNAIVQTDSVEVMLISSQQELDEKFTIDKSAGDAAKPDFLINYVVAVTTLPGKNKAVISMDKVETGDSDINIYLTILKEQGKGPLSRTSQVFAIEKRSGFIGLQFFVNGKKSTALILPMG